MSFIQNFYTSRDNNTDGNTYVGQEGRLWYNPDTNSIYVNTANVAGGTPVDLATGANITANIITVNTVTSTSGTVTVTGNLTITGNISPAAEGKIGGIQPGPGVVIGNTGILTIDSANLPVSFGNFFANNNILSIVNADEDMILQTEGDAEIQLIGNVGFYKPDGIPPDVANRFAFFNSDGQVEFFVPTEDPIAGAVKIIGSASGEQVPPAVAGVMLHITGQPNAFSTIYNDGANNFPNFIGRRYNGNTTSPTQVTSGQTIVRFSGQGYTSSGFSGAASGSLSLDALENFTGTNQGAVWRFLVNPVAGNTRQEVANVSVANGITATQFNTAGTISATGNITGGNLTLNSGGLISSTGLISTTGNISAGNISTAGNITGNTLTSTFVVLPAGTSARAPLVFTSGSLQSSPTTGAMNYDGRVFYATPQSTERGLIVTEQVYIPNADYTLLDQTAVQSLFGVSVSLSSGTRYAYRLLSVIYKTANNISLQYATSGNLVLAKHSYQTTTTASANLATLSTPSLLRNILTTGFDTPVTVSGLLNTTGYYSLTVNGTLNVTTGGTWTPLVAFTGLPGAGSYLAAGSSIEIWPIGPTGANVSIGNWT